MSNTVLLLKQVKQAFQTKLRQAAHPNDRQAGPHHGGHHVVERQLLDLPSQGAAQGVWEHAYLWTSLFREMGGCFRIHSGAVSTVLKTGSHVIGGSLELFWMCFRHKALHHLQEAANESFGCFRPQGSTHSDFSHWSVSDSHQVCIILPSHNNRSLPTTCALALVILCVTCILQVASPFDWIPLD